MGLFRPVMGQLYLYIDVNRKTNGVACGPSKMKTSRQYSPVKYEVCVASTFCRLYVSASVSLFRLETAQYFVITFLG